MVSVRRRTRTAAGTGPHAPGTALAAEVALQVGGEKRGAAEGQMAPPGRLLLRRGR